MLRVNVNLELGFCVEHGGAEVALAFQRCVLPAFFTTPYTAHMIAFHLKTVFSLFVYL